MFLSSFLQYILILTRVNLYYLLFAFEGLQFFLFLICYF